MSLVGKYKNFRPFTNDEAWGLFRLVAIGEACGWTILISGLVIQHFNHSNIPVLLAGQIHGLLFLIYLSATVLVAPSLRWNFKRTFTALLFSVPPYGTLIFELIVSGQRRNSELSELAQRTVYSNLLELGG